METELIVGLLVVAAVVIVGAVAALMYWQKRRSDELAQQYGPEYHRVVEEQGDRRKAEHELATRRDRVRELEIRPLDPDHARSYRTRWDEVQAAFVDRPGEAIGDADRLVEEVMEERGYPVGDFDRMAEDVSVDHPRVVDHYRSAHAVAVRHSQEDVDTEVLRRAIVDYRALFDELLETDEGPVESTDETPQPVRTSR
jgi:hypothetical protein